MAPERPCTPPPARYEGEHGPELVRPAWAQPGHKSSKLLVVTVPALNQADAAPFKERLTKELHDNGIYDTKIVLLAGCTSAVLLS